MAPEQLASQLGSDWRLRAGRTAGLSGRLAAEWLQHDEKVESLRRSHWLARVGSRLEQ